MNPPEMLSAVTVVVPAYNAAGTIGETLAAILGQTLKPAEVIVVDDGSTDDTARVARDAGGTVRVITQPNAGPAAARNRGIVAATSPVVAFTDSDCRPTETWLADLLTGFESDRVAGVGGHVKGIGTNLISRYVDFTRILEPGLTDDGIVSLVTANACFRRSVLLEVGLFCERFRKPGGEEPELCERIRAAGYQFRAVDGGVVYHHHKQTIRVLLKTMSNYGRGYYIGSTIMAQPIWSNHPRVLLVRKSLDVRTFLKRIDQNKRALGYQTGTAFAGLNYLCDLAFCWGYIRESRADAAGKRLA